MESGADSSEGEENLPRPYQRSYAYSNVELRTVGGVPRSDPSRTSPGSKAAKAAKYNTDLIYRPPPPQPEDSRRNSEPDVRSREARGPRGPLPSPDVMAKAANARSLLYVPVDVTDASMSSTLPRNGKDRDLIYRPPPPKPDLRRRDSAPDLQEHIWKQRPKSNASNPPSPTSETGLKELTRGEEPQLLWERSRSRSPEKLARASQFSLFPHGEMDRRHRLKSTSPVRSVSPSFRSSPRSPRSPSGTRTPAKDYSRSIHVTDTPWTRHPSSPVPRPWK
ncbi:unnamed protein product [Effrenium voratum]|nr:unnamed protein product [Effrenium voratum]